MNWLNWLCIDFVNEGLCVQTLLRTLADKRGNLMGWRQTNIGS